MGMDTVLDSAQAEVTTACAALRDLQELEFWKIPELDLLGLAQSIEGLARLGYAAQVRVAGEIDTRHTAANFGSASTVALLRETLTISAPDARARVNTATMVLPRLQPSGSVADPVLPELAAALSDGAIGVDQTRIVVATIKGASGKADPGMLAEAKKVLVQTGAVTEPKPFAAFAKSVAHALDLDGKPDTEPSDRVELTIGVRNPDTGMTGFKGQLDDVGVELLGKAIEGLTNTTRTRTAPPTADPGRPTGAGAQGSPHPVPECRRGTDAWWGTTAHHADDGLPGPAEPDRRRLPRTRRRHHRRGGAVTRVRRRDHPDGAGREVRGPGRRPRPAVVHRPDPQGDHPTRSGVLLPRL